MSAPYFCTLCGRQHVRGKVYDEHKPHKQPTFHDGEPGDKSSPKRCLDCGVPFENQDNPTLDSWFECSECGATHVYWKGRWWLEDDADDHGRRAEGEMKAEIVAGEVRNTPAYKVPVTDGIDGPIIGTAMMNNNGTMEMEVDVKSAAGKSLSNKNVGVSLDFTSGMPSIKVNEYASRMAFQEEIDKAAIPDDIQPLPKVTAIVASEVVNTPAYAEMESRKEFHKENQLGLHDRVVESLQVDEVGHVRHGEPVKKKWWPPWRRG